jgi:membrane-associated PAP2 superfamily phosphatase
MLPLLLLSLLFVLVTGSDFDQMLASWFYQLQGGQWLLQNYWLTETVLHQGVRQVNQWVMALLLCYWLTLVVTGRRASSHRALGVLLLSLILCFSSVALFKKYIPMDCPWDLQQFGGDKNFVGLFSFRPETMAPNQCFPAGHASIGYGWMALYYFCLLICPAKARLALFSSICLGLVLGFAQQLRGAHFISHDIATAAVCWLIVSFTFRWFYPQAALCTLPSNPMHLPLESAVTRHAPAKEPSDV